VHAEQARSAALEDVSRGTSAFELRWRVDTQDTFVRGDSLIGDPRGTPAHRLHRSVGSWSASEPSRARYVDSLRHPRLKHAATGSST
jgi:hypothetical protein